MKNVAFLVVVCMCALILAGCALGPIIDKDSKGGLVFDFDLAYPKSLGYDITQVQVTLTHQGSGREVIADLAVDSLNNRASGLVRNLRPGVWDVLVELYEDGILMGQGATEVEIKAGITSQVTVRITLAAGHVEVIVDWGEVSGPNMSLSEFDSDFGEIEVGSLSEPREVTIYNTGTEDLALSGISLSDTDNYLIDLDGGSDPVGSEDAVIPPGGKATFTITCAPTSTGTHPMNLQIASNVVLTPIIQLPWTVVGRPMPILMPNLSPVGFTSPSTAYAGEAIGEMVTLGVFNSLGEANAADGFITVAFYLSTDWLWTPADVLLDNGRVDVSTPIAYNETRPVSSWTLRVPDGTPLGEYYLLAVVDEGNEVTETSETNNVGANAITIGPLAQISGTLTVGAVGESGNYLDVEFTSNENIQLVDVNWDWTGHNVWVDIDGVNMVDPINNGVTSFSFHFGDPPVSTPPGSNFQIFGYSAVGFNPGDYLRITADLDVNESGGTPLYEDYYGGKATLRFNDGTTIVAVYDTPVSGDAFAAQASFDYSP